jgi:L-glyceraldehyde 3-phosphate reductase
MTSALIGASRVEQIKEAVAALDNLEFSQAELNGIERNSGDAGINIWLTSSER